MDHLWSPWRLEYVISKKPEGCVFCLRGDESAQADLVVHRGQLAYVILNLYPYNNGHIMVVPYRHVATFALLNVEELQELALLTQRSEIALNEAYRPQAMNVGANLGRPAGGGIPEHLHVHLVPRWTGDSNFMTVTAQTRLVPEELEVTFDKLAPRFQDVRVPQ
jgi:ATP adenylyltransferase